ncbi:MAG: NUDIX domain-containing protein [Phycisphaerales bacterium]|jgi:8-oxo-dGTP pyrophosphatase MutT (NUDIX family)
MSTKELHIEVIARAAMFHGEHLLLCRSIDGGYAYLPGGHVEFGESSEAAAARELQEEAGIEVIVGRCLHVHEQIFRQGGRLRHELNVVFHVEHADKSGMPGAPPPVIPSLEKHIAFEWVSLASLRDIDLRPAAANAWLQSFDSVESLLAAEMAWIRSEE